MTPPVLHENFLDTLKVPQSMDISSELEISTDPGMKKIVADKDEDSKRRLSIFDTIYPMLSDVEMKKRKSLDGGQNVVRSFDSSSISRNSVKRQSLSSSGIVRIQQISIDKLHADQNSNDRAVKIERLPPEKHSADKLTAMSASSPTGNEYTIHKEYLRNDENTKNSTDMVSDHAMHDIALHVRLSNNETDSNKLQAVLNKKKVQIFNSDSIAELSDSAENVCKTSVPKVESVRRRSILKEFHPKSDNRDEHMNGSKTRRNSVVFTDDNDKYTDSSEPSKPVYLDHHHHPCFIYLLFLDETLQVNLTA